MVHKTMMAALLLILLAGTACAGVVEELDSKVTSEGTTPVMPTEELQPADSQTLSVVQIGAMSVERAAHQATLLGSGEVLISGGCAGNHCDLYHASVELFDPDTHQFREASPMSTSRAGHVAVELPDGRVLVAGGWTGQRAAASAEVYDPTTDEWTPVGDMVEGRESLMAVPLPDSRILIAGGSGGVKNFATAEIFDPDIASFSVVGQMGANLYLATSLADGRVLMTGGQSDTGEVLTTAEIFDPATNEFKPTGSMASGRVKHAGALLPDGRILIVGGSDERGYSERFSSTEIYDPITEEFSPGPVMRWARHKIRDAVVVLPSGAVLVAGGAPRLELFDPVQEVFVPLEGELSGPQMFATATLLPSGEVLVLGGYDGNTRSSASAWLVQTSAGAQP